MNCKKEFLAQAKEKPILCAQIIIGDSFSDEIKTFNLKKCFSSEDFLRFIKSLDFEYDDGFGGQELFGFIWYTDGSWSERGEYDGSEWWEYKYSPEISKELLDE